MSTLCAGELLAFIAKKLNITTNIPIVSLKGDVLNVCKNLQPLHTGSSIALKWV